MRAISSHRRSYTMRVLILSAFLACATAAPSVPVPIVPFLPATNLFRAPIAAIPVALPTISPGDIQAATIDAQVKAEDQARAFADQARELAELAAENQNIEVMSVMTKEKTDLDFWAAEEKKQRALDAERVAAAQADGNIARSAYVPYVDSSVPEPEQPMIEVAAKAAEIPTIEAAETPEAPKEEPAVRMADPEPEAKTEKTDSVQVETGELKSAPAKMEMEKPIAAPVLASLITSRAYNHPFVAPIAYIQPGLHPFASPAIYPGHFVAPHLLQPW